MVRYFLPRRSAGRCTVLVKAVDFDTIEEAQVEVRGCCYRVDFGPDVDPRFAQVFRSEATVPQALAAVSTYLRNGGEPAEEAPLTFWAVLPMRCPICGAQVRLCSDPPIPSRRGAEWECIKGGRSCYWSYQGQALAEQSARRRHEKPPE